MQFLSKRWRWAIQVLALAALCDFAPVMCGRLSAEDAAPQAAVPEAVRNAAVAGAPPAPDEVKVGVYVNDIHELDFRTNSYSVDLYIWFRWRNSGSNPVKGMEFMNRFTPTDHQRDTLLEKPKAMPDGSFYGIIREQGRFSAKFRLERYPYDEQVLKVVFEDSVSTIGLQRYAPDTVAISMNPEITLPGYKVGRPSLHVITNVYPTNFGDISLTQGEAYSRVIVEMPVTRPLFTASIKNFVPILLIIVCSTLVLLVRPLYVEGRIGLCITALLTLVALQLTAAATLPDVDYLMLIDKAYLVSYAYIIAVLSRVVWASWVETGDKSEETVRSGDRRAALILVFAYAAIMATTFGWALARPVTQLAAG